MQAPTPKEVLNAIIGNSAPLSRVLDLVRIVAPKDVRVLIRGERGTGKELAADAIHALSGRGGMPFVKINCAALQKDLFASELFGHVRGSFTGAVSTRTGLILAADGGSLFLDEIGDLSPDAQAAILRFLQEGEVRPIGSLQTFPADVRVIAATNKNLEEAIKQGAFREDLYDRLNGFTLHLPPLRERKEDIPALVDHFIEKYNRRYDENVRGFSKEALEILLDYPWPGNVRELENVASRAVILSQGRSRAGVTVLPDILPGYEPKAKPNFHQSGESTRAFILGIIKEKQKATVKDIQAVLAISDRAIRYHLEQMVKMGLVTLEGSKKGSSYSLH